MTDIEKKLIKLALDVREGERLILQEDYDEQAQRMMERERGQNEK